MASPGLNEALASTSFEELVTPNFDKLRRVASRLEWRPECVDDLLQESLMQGLRKFYQLRDPARFVPWMRTIIHRTAWNQRSRFNPEVPLELEVIDGEGVYGLTPPAENPEEQLVTKRRHDEVRGAFQSLPHDQRIAVFLVDTYGFSYAETADLLKVAPGTVASRVHRGRKTLQSLLKHLSRAQSEDG